MNNIIKTIVAATMAFVITGCDKLPTPERMTEISTAIGKTAAVACELSKTKKEVREAILNVLDIAGKVVPAPGKTFTETWTPIIKEEVQKLVDAGKLDKAAATTVQIALAAACSGLDYVFVKYPKAKDVEELVAASITGFINGYKSVGSLMATENLEIDNDAYEYIKKNI